MHAPVEGEEGQMPKYLTQGNYVETAAARVAVLLTPEEIDAASKKTAGYRPPGKWEAQGSRRQ